MWLFASFLVVLFGIPFSRRWNLCFSHFKMCLVFYRSAVCWRCRWDMLRWCEKMQNRPRLATKLRPLCYFLCCVFFFSFSDRQPMSWNLRQQLQNSSLYRLVGWEDNFVATCFFFCRSVKTNKKSHLGVWELIQSVGLWLIEHCVESLVCYLFTSAKNKFTGSILLQVAFWREFFTSV